MVEPEEPALAPQLEADERLAGGEPATEAEHPRTNLVFMSRNQRKSRMVEISLSGSGGGPGKVTTRGYPTCDQARLVHEEVECEESTETWFVVQRVRIPPGQG